MIDLSTWNLTIPEQYPAQTIQTTVVKAGYRDPYFYRSGRNIVFWAPVTGTTTKGSSYPRSELRETFTNGKQRNWYYREGLHQLRAAVTVQQIPSSQRIVIGQIHSKDNSKPFVKVVYRQVRGTGYVTVELRKKPGDLKSPVVLTYKGMPMNTRFSYGFDVTKNGVLRIGVNNMVYRGKVDPGWANKRFYFKAGVYTLDNKGPRTEGGRVVFHDLRVKHSK